MSRFHARSLYSYSRCTQETSHDCFLRYHTRSEFIQPLSRCAHEECPKTISVLTHAKSVLSPFSRYHARSIIRQQPRQQQQHHTEWQTWSATIVLI